MSNNIKFNSGRVALDLTYQEIDNILFEDQSKVMDQWREIYPEAIGPFTHGISEPSGITVQIICYVDTNHAENILNRRSHSGILIYINNTLVIRYYKR